MLIKPTLHILAAFLFALLSFTVWRIAYQWTDWAVLALIPFAVVIAYGTWSLTMEPWRAKLHLIVREESTLARYLTGRIRACFITVVFTVVAITVLAWKALNASWLEMLVMCSAFFLSACCLSVFQSRFSRHFHQPFDRSMAVSTATWLASIVVFIVLFVMYWGIKRSPGELLAAETIMDAVMLAQKSLPVREGLITTVISGLASYENLKLWLVIKLRDYPLGGILYSFDAALWVYVLCRSAVVSTELIKINVFRDEIDDQVSQTG